MIALDATVLMIQFLYVIAISINPEFRFQRAQAGFPSWKFTLPVRTSILVAYSYLVRFGFVGFSVGTHELSGLASKRRRAGLAAAWTSLCNPCLDTGDLLVSTR